MTRVKLMRFETVINLTKYLALSCKEKLIKMLKLKRSETFIHKVFGMFILAISVHLT